MNFPAITPQIEARFWRHVDTSDGQGPHGDCWQWTGALDFDGKYPSGFGIEGKRYRASHVALAIVGKPRPSLDLYALHSCDNPQCVRHDHLRWGTELDNRIDAIARRKRSRSFSADEVRLIRASLARNCDLAREYGVTQACIYNIRKRVSHHHVD
jgi:hypothetical protein